VAARQRASRNFGVYFGFVTFNSFLADRLKKLLPWENLAWFLIWASWLTEA
jgi:hypothetical protein